MTMKWIYLLIVLMCSGCLGNTWEQLQEHFTETATTGGDSSTTTGALPTTSDGVEATPVRP